MQINFNTNDRTSFGLTNNKKAAREVLKNIASGKRNQIYRDIEQFCQITQQRGIKGEFRLEGPDSFSVTPHQTGKKTVINNASLELNYFFAALNLNELNHSQPFGMESSNYIFLRRISTQKHPKRKNKPHFLNINMTANTRKTKPTR